MVINIKNIFDDIEQDINEISKANFSVENRNSIPDNIPLENFHWYLIPNLTSVFVDMVDSSKLPLNRISAKIYQAFIHSFVKVFNYFNTEYIDIKGDGGFALFSGKDSVIPALCAAVTFRTICNNKIENGFLPQKVFVRIGIDVGTALVKRIGLRGEKNNEVWLGLPVNMSSKLSANTEENSVAISEKVYNIINSHEYKDYLVNSCGCPNNKIVSLWKEQENNNKDIIYDKFFILSSVWCKKHGKDFCEKVMDIYNRSKNK